MASMLGSKFGRNHPGALQNCVASSWYSAAAAQLHGHSTAGHFDFMLTGTRRYRSFEIDSRWVKQIVQKSKKKQTQEDRRRRSLWNCGIQRSGIRSVRGPIAKPNLAYRPWYWMAGQFTPLFRPSSRWSRPAFSLSTVTVEAALPLCVWLNRNHRPIVSASIRVTQRSRLSTVSLLLPVVDLFTVIIFM